MTPAEQFKHNGYTVKIIQDRDAESPDKDGDNGLFIVTTRNRYFQVLHNDWDAKTLMEHKDDCKGYWIFPLRAYIHSGVALSLGSGGQFSDPWDSGQIGFVFASKAEWKYETRDTKRCASAFKAAQALVETWNQYLSGDVYGFVIEQPNGDDVDSCWGVYGLEYCKSEAISCVPGEPATHAEECGELEDTLS
jgi:hypothetical protein